MTPEKHKQILDVVKARLDEIGKNEMEKAFIWHLVGDILPEYIKYMMAFKMIGMSPNQFIETLRALADGIELVFQEAYNSKDK